MTSNSNTGDDKEKASCPSLFAAMFAVAVVYVFVVVVVCLEIRDSLRF